MTTLYRVLVLSLLLYIVALLLGKQAVTSVAPKSEFIQEEEAQFAERMIRRAKDNRDASAERHAKKRLGVN